MSGLFRPAVLLLTLASAVCRADCIDNSRQLVVDELERFGIRMQIEPAKHHDATRINIALQPEVCIKTDEKQCSLAKYNVDSAVLVFPKTQQPLVLHRPNPYEVQTEAAINRSDIAGSQLKLVYRGEPCDGGHFRRQTFTIDLNQAIHGIR